VSKDKKLNKGTSREVEVEQDTRENIDIFNGGLYHCITIGSREECNFGNI